MAEKKQQTPAKKPTKRGINFESFDDVDLNKAIDLEAGKDAVQVDSPPELEPKPKSTPKGKTSATKKRTTKSKTTAAPKKKVQEELIRTTIDFPKSEHRKLKILAMDEDMKLYQYLYMIIKKHLDRQ